MTEIIEKKFKIIVSSYIVILIPLLVHIYVLELSNKYIIDGFMFYTTFFFLGVFLTHLNKNKSHIKKQNKIMVYALTIFGLLLIMISIFSPIKLYGSGTVVLLISLYYTFIQNGTMLLKHKYMHSLIDKTKKYNYSIISTLIFLFVPFSIDINKNILKISNQTYLFEIVIYILILLIIIMTQFEKRS